MRLSCAAALVATALLSHATAAQANDVTLTSNDGALEVSGTLSSYDGDVYEIETAFGTLTVSADAALCAGVGCPVAGSFVAEWTITGARSGTDVLLPALLQAFAVDRGLTLAREDGDAGVATYVLAAPDRSATVARIGLRTARTARGFDDLVSGATDMVVATRQPDGSEQDRAIEAGLGRLADPAQSRLLALDALVAVVADGAGQDAIAMDDLVRLVARPGETSLHLPVSGSAAADTLASRLLVPRGVSAADSATRHSDAEGIARAVVGEPGALGLMLLSEAGSLRPLAIDGSCGARSPVEAQQIKTEDYPLTVGHYLYLPRRRMPALAREFVTFLASDPAQAAVRGAGFIDQTIEYTPLSVQGDRLARAILATGEEVGAGALRSMLGALSGAVRLTPTFRFEDGSADLDAPSRANVALVAHAVSGGAFDGGELLVAGFSDGQGGAAANLALSRERAAAVRAALEGALSEAERDKVTFVDQGFGETSPLSCDEDDWGRSVNRRVELWWRQR